LLAAYSRRSATLICVLCPVMIASTSLAKSDAFASVFGLSMPPPPLLASRIGIRLPAKMARLPRAALATPQFS
jgi:hypothetical protein